MSWNHIESNWKSLKATIQQNWSKLSDEDVDKINGNRDLLISAIQEKYASSRSDAQTEVENWQSSQSASNPQLNESSGSKYNPDYSGSDSNLSQGSSQDKKPGSISNDPNDPSNEHEEKSIDQT